MRTCRLPSIAIVAGTAFARWRWRPARLAGDRCSPVDRNAYYGGSGAGFSLELQAWAAERTERAESRADEEVGVQLTAARPADKALGEGFSDVAVVPLDDARRRRRARGVRRYRRSSVARGDGGGWRRRRCVVVRTATGDSTPTPHTE